MIRTEQKAQETTTSATGAELSIGDNCNKNSFNQIPSEIPPEILAEDTKFYEERKRNSALWVKFMAISCIIGSILSIVLGAGIGALLVFAGLV